MSALTVTSRAAQASQTRELLIRTAEQLFAVRGYDATSLQAIADEVGLTKAAIYYYYKTKAELLEAINRDRLQRLLAIAEQAQALASPEERIDYLIDAVLDLVITSRRTVELTERDPVQRRDSKRKHDNDAAKNAVLRAVYGPTPSLAQQAAFHLCGNLPAVLTELSHLSDDELRSTLGSLCRRVLTVD
jgi:AcrR family transcriptional regulator